MFGGTNSIFKKTNWFGLGRKRSGARVDSPRKELNTYKLVFDGGYFVIKNEKGENVPDLPAPHSDKDVYLKELSNFFTSPCIEAFKHGYPVELAP